MEDEVVFERLDYIACGGSLSGPSCELYSI